MGGGALTNRSQASALNGPRTVFPLGRERT
jgi:hypothetical protein